MIGLDRLRVCKSFKFISDKGDLLYIPYNANASRPLGTHPIVEIDGVAEVEVVGEAAHSKHGAKRQVQKTLSEHNRS